MRRRLGVVGFAAKPGETNGDPAADRTARFPVRLPAYEDHFLSARRSPRHHLGTLQVNFARDRRGCDAHFRQATISSEYLCNTRYSESFIQLVDLHRGALLVKLYLAPERRARIDPMGRFPAIE